MSGTPRWLAIGLPVVALVAAVAGTVQVLSTRTDTKLLDPLRSPPGTAPPASGAPGSDRAALERIDPRMAAIGATGTVEPASEQIRIGTPLAGVVAAVHVRPGDVVAGGGLLYELDARQLTAEIASREEQVKAARAKLQELAAGAPAAVARVAAARADLEDRRQQLAAAESVGDRRAIAAEEMVRRRHAFDGAEARFLEARASAALLDPASGAPTLAAQRALVMQFEAVLEEAKVQRERLRVRAPFDVEVLQVNVRPGEFAVAGLSSPAAMVVGTMQPLHVRVDIDEVDVPRFARERVAVAVARGDPADRRALRFVRVDPVLVPKTALSGTIDERVDTRVLRVVYAVEPAVRGRWFPGQQVDIFIEPARDMENARSRRG